MHCPSAIDHILGHAQPHHGPIASLANWNAWTPPELKARLPFRPTVRTPAQLAGDEWAWIRDGDAEVVHFLNEPERQSPPVPAADAARLWRERMVGELRAQKGKKLVGPSVASDPPGSAWLRAFMAELKKPAETPDYMGAHWYGGGGKEGVDAAKAYLKGLHDEFGLPLVVSEIGCLSRDEGEVVRWTADMANWMDGTEWVAEYAFFGCMRHVADDFVSPAAQLMDSDGTPTRLMQKLMSEVPMTYA